MLFRFMVRERTRETERKIMKCHCKSRFRNNKKRGRVPQKHAESTDSLSCFDCSSYLNLGAIHVVKFSGASHSLDRFYINVSDSTCPTPTVHDLLLTKGTSEHYNVVKRV